MRTASLLIVLLLAGAITANFGLQKVGANISPAVTSLVNFILIANIEAWNGTFFGCTSGTPSCNPTKVEFRNVAFTVQVNWGDCCTHDFAIYTAGFPASSVDTTNLCSLSNTNGCLAVSANVLSSTTSLTFTPAVPKDDFSGPGAYEYYCQFHPGSMHGKFTIYKNPDLDHDGKVDISDVSILAFAFGATPTSPTWNVAADLDNSGKIDISDVSIIAFYFGQLI